MSISWSNSLLRNFSSNRFALIGSMVLASSIPQLALGQSGGNLVQLPLPVPSVLQQSMLVAHKSAQDIVHVAISLSPPNPAALQAFADSVSNPKSPMYGKWATPAQLGNQFGQPAAVVQSVVTYLKSKGFNVTLVGDSHLTILADATVAQAESAFDTTINKYHLLAANPAVRTDYYSFSEPLHLPASFASKVVSVDGLDTVAKPLPRLKKHAFSKGKKLNQTPLTPTQTRTLYGVAPMWTAVNQGKGRNIAISSFDGFLLSNVPLYYKQFALPTPAGGVGSNVSVITIDGGSQTATPGGEADLDIQMVLGMAPLCSFRVYDGGANLIDVLTKEQNDNTSEIISESYGWALSASGSTACHNEHVLMTAQGMTYMEATGDYGTQLEPFAYSNYEPEVFQVGGTTANTDNAGNRTSEVGWSGSGGGWATESVPFNVLPSWQRGKGVPTTINFRLNPDAALNAAGDTTGAYQFYFNGALEFGYDGTSFASPVFAGSLGITLSKVIALGGASRLGRIQDAVYLQNGRPDVWFDVTSGFNGSLPNGALSQATLFWDSVTGWGSVNFSALATSLAVSPAVIYPCTAISAYDNVGLSPAVIEGTNAAGGAASLTSVDGLGYSLQAVRETLLGRVATMQATFSTNLIPANLNSLSLTLAGTADPNATITVYLLNQGTGKYVAVKSISGTALKTASTITIPTASMTSYVNSAGTVQALVRYLVPNSRLGVASNFSFFLDELYISGSQFLN